jgi:hypothetical protein
MTMQRSGNTPLKIGDWIRILEPDLALEDGDEEVSLRDIFPPGTISQVTGVEQASSTSNPWVWVMHPLDKERYQYPFSREQVFGPLTRDEIPACFLPEDDQ